MGEEKPGLALVESESMDHSNVLSREERHLLRKCDRRILPILFCLLIIAFINRVNIGNAKIQGLEKDLHLKNHEYNVALFVLFVPFILFEIPSNLILKRVSPSKWLSTLIFLQGIVTVCQGLVSSYSGLVVARFFLGLFEAGFTPGCAYLLSMYYKRYEYQWRFSIFYIGSIVAPAFGGLLAYGIAHMDGVRGYKAWRWIFIIEGLVAVVAAFFGWWLIVDWPTNTKFLSEEEKQLLARRLSSDMSRATMSHLNRRALRRIFQDWKIYVGMFMYLSIVNSGLGLTLFLPSIIKDIGYTAAGAQVRSVPVFIAAAICALATAYASDRFRHRFSFCIVGVVVAAIGYIMLLKQERLTPGVRYFATFVVACGVYITQPLTIGWLSNNVAGHYKRGVAVAFQYGFGNIGGIIASNIYLSSQAPRYPVGYGVSLALLLLCGILCCVFFVGIKIENRKRDTGLRDWRLAMPDEEKENLGDDYPGFRFST